MKILALLLAQVVFSWQAPLPEENITKVEIKVTAEKGNYEAAQVINAGLPPVISGKQSFTAFIDVSTPKWAIIQGVNSFGSSPPTPEIRLGKPSVLGEFVARPQ